MYDQRKLYYLQQMGIRPWVSATPIISNKLIVLMSSRISAKAQALTKRFLSLIQLGEDELEVVHIQDNDLSSQLKNKNPWMILSLGFQAKELEPLNLNCHIVSTYSPEFLLQFPLQKKVLLKDLQFINVQILAKKAS
ncbi:MAG: hypothetical protein EPN84_07205 [Legionella sp.]|nr:MAG: hypothetical protein EPN84_07205 [Legionella sp.]